MQSSAGALLIYFVAFLTFRYSVTMYQSLPRRRTFSAALAFLISTVLVAGGSRSPAHAQGASLNLQASVAGTTVSFAWSPASGAGGYRIEAGSAPGLSNLATLTVPVTTTYAVPNVPPGIYYVRVRALGVDAVSNDVTVTVSVGGAPGSCFEAPDTPIRLQGNTNGTQVSLSWQPASTGCPATSYILRAGSTAGTADIASIQVGSSSFSANAPDGVYFVSVIAVNAFGASAPTGSLVVPVAAPTAGGRVSFNTSTPAISADEQGNAVVIGEVFNRSLSPAVFIQVFAQILGPQGELGTRGTFLRGETRRLVATGVTDDSALAPGEIGCFYIQTGIPIGSVRGANLQLSHDTFASVKPANRVGVVAVSRIPSAGAATLSTTLANGGAQTTFFNRASLYLKGADGRAVGCDVAFIQTADASLAAGQSASLTTVTHAPASSTSAIAWTHWQESGDPVGALASQTFETMRGLIESRQKGAAYAAWEALQEQRRALVRQAGR